MLKYLQLLEVVHGTPHLDTQRYLLKPLAVVVEPPLLGQVTLGQAVAVVVPEDGLLLKLLEKP